VRTARRSRAPAHGCVLMATICIIDDDADVVATLGGFYEHAGHRVLGAATASAGIALVGRSRPDVVVLDLELPDLSGIEVLAALRIVNPVVLVLSGHLDVARSLEAMRLGAEAVLEKPIDLELLGAATERAVEKARLRQLSRSVGRRTSAVGRGTMLGTSPAMRELSRQLELLARNDPAPILLHGEVGTGKGRVAELLHARSPRMDRPFVELSCVALGAGLLDAEMFGHGADVYDSPERRAGLLAAAEGGSLFLDEIGALDPQLQPRLLEILEGRHLHRGRRDESVPSDVRIIASTARDLVTGIAEGRFREDLYYRISITPVHIPPLRMRAREDILDAASLMLDELRSQLPEAPAELADEARDNLLRYSWPGNLRELRNVLERSMILARGQSRIEVDHLPPEVRRSQQSGVERHTPRSLAEVERLHIERTLRVHSQNRTRAARELGISRATLINKIKTYGVESRARSGETDPGQEDQ
jgi:DNA-binding NtrC family response regulator